MNLFVFPIFYSLKAFKQHSIALQPNALLFQRARLSIQREAIAILQYQNN